MEDASSHQNAIHCQAAMQSQGRAARSQMKMLSNAHGLFEIERGVESSQGATAQRIRARSCPIAFCISMLSLVQELKRNLVFEATAQKSPLTRPKNLKLVILRRQYDSPFDAFTQHCVLSCKRMRRCQEYIVTEISFCDDEDVGKNSTTTSHHLFQTSMNRTPWKHSVGISPKIHLVD